MPVTYKPTNVVISPFIRYSGTSAYNIIPDSNRKQKIAPTNYYLDLIDISHKSNKNHNKQYSHESQLLNDKDLNETLGLTSSFSILQIVDIFIF